MGTAELMLGRGPGLRVTFTPLSATPPSAIPNRERLTIVAYAGDFREASLRLARGGAENYRAQRYTVEFVESLVPRMESVTVVVAITDEPYDETLSNGVRCVGLGFTEATLNARALVRAVAGSKPDRLITRAPFRALLFWAVTRRVKTLALLADSFNGASFRARAGLACLTLLLRMPAIEVVGNHGTLASEQLHSAGVPARKVVAWDFPASDVPSDRGTKLEPIGKRLIYVGTLSELKGVGDLLRACAELRARGFFAEIDLVGGGDSSFVRNLTRELHLEAVVNVVGLVSNDEMVTRMACADVVVVPSRHEYGEGVPLTIYEALCSRTPIVASDHPMFRRALIHEDSALIFASGDISELADAVQRLLSDHHLYERLSHNASAAWERLQVPAKWDVIIDRWIASDASSREWLAAHSLAGVR